jgi:hypothetical protein
MFSKGLYADPQKQFSQNNSHVSRYFMSQQPDASVVIIICWIDSFVGGGISRKIHMDGVCR